MFFNINFSYNKCKIARCDEILLHNKWKNLFEDEKRLCDKFLEIA